MSSSPMQMPSPCSTERERDSSPQPDTKAVASAARMLKIHSLLNPSSSDHSRMRVASVSPPPTPAYTYASSVPSTPRSLTPSTPLPKRPKLIKDAALYVRGTPKQPVNYPPFECTEDAVCLTMSQRSDLALQHERFQISPNGSEGQGCIGDYQRHIPYSSDKKSFGKTSREAFEVFQYTFRVPGDPDDKEYLVMWDYQVGLVRITPFFKALKYSKTTPAKALTTNPGLKDLSHSITGGALAAQGYWMPYSCARAVCLTFCYPIRWALTPIFGPSFTKECLRPEHPGYCRFKISSEVVRCAALQAEDWVSDASSRSASPVSTYAGQNDATRQIPRSVPPPTAPHSQHQPIQRPQFKLGSPFQADSGSSIRNYTRRPAEQESQELSPKTTRRTAWTSINSRSKDTAPPPPSNSRLGSLSHSLLIQPRKTPNTSWRGLEDAVTTSNYVVKMPTGAHDKHRVHKRRISISPEVGVASRNATYVCSVSPSTSEKDNTDPRVSQTTKKRQRREDTPGPASLVQTVESKKTKPGKSVKYSTADARAAQWLLNLSVRDSQLAQGPTEVKCKRRLSSF